VGCGGARDGEGDCGVWGADVGIAFYTLGGHGGRDSPLRGEYLVVMRGDGDFGDFDARGKVPKDDNFRYSISKRKGKVTIGGIELLLPVATKDWVARYIRTVKPTAHWKVRLALDTESQQH
jgi:hypothetical protein